jgi:hypothetical protein
MHRVRSLRILRVAALRRLARVTTAIKALPGPSRERKMIVAFCMLEAVDMLAAFVRAFYISSVLGAERGKHQPITCAATFRNPTAALTYAAAWRYKRRWPGGSPPPYKPDGEPAWHRLNNIKNIAHDLRLSNEPTITSALARAGASVEDLIALRNYCAHRNSDTKKIAAATLYKYAITPDHSIETSLCQLVPTLSVLLIELLFTDLYDIIDIMAR